MIVELSLGLKKNVKDSQFHNQGKYGVLVYM